MNMSAKPPPDVFVFLSIKKCYNKLVEVTVAMDCGSLRDERLSEMFEKCRFKLNDDDGTLVGYYKKDLRVVSATMLDALARWGYKIDKANEPVVGDSSREFRMIKSVKSNNTEDKRAEQNDGVPDMDPATSFQ